MNYSNISQMFYYQVEQKSSKRFISHEGKFYDYSQAGEIVAKTAKLLQSYGVKKGSKVIILMNNSPEFMFAALAIFACGAIAIPINVFFKTNEITYIINDSEASFLISSGDFQIVLENISELCPNLDEIFSFDGGVDNSISIYDESANLSASFDDSPACYTDLALFIYTSGTTGHPKGAMLTHENLISNVSSFSGVINATTKDKFLVMLPMFHTYTFTTCFLYPVYLGAGIIILTSVMDMKKDSFKKILIFQRPTFVLGVPQVYTALLKSPMPKWFIKLLYPIKNHISGGAALPMEVFERFREKFGIPVIEGYGLSEASPVVSLNPPAKPKAGTIGKPLPGVMVKIVDINEEEVPQGKVGELIVKGKNVMQGYWRMPKATDDAIKNGWLFTGDMACIDEDGYISIVDRKKDLIISKGMNIYPREIEEVIYTFPGVDAVAVIGLPSDEYGEIVAAYIQPKSGETIDEHALKKKLKIELANFKQPKHVKVIDNIPLTATGKVLKRKLKELVKNGQI